MSFNSLNKRLLSFIENATDMGDIYGLSDELSDCASEAEDRVMDLEDEAKGKEPVKDEKDSLVKEVRTFIESSDVDSIQGVEDLLAAASTRAEERLSELGDG